VYIQIQTAKRKNLKIQTRTQGRGKRNKEERIATKVDSQINGNQGIISEANYPEDLKVILPAESIKSIR